MVDEQVALALIDFDDPNVMWSLRGLNCSDRFDAFWCDVLAYLRR